jgi:hypothetical protein
MTELPYQRAFHRIRSEFFAAPDTRLTAAQVEGLAGVDREICRTVLEDLVRAGFLQHSEGSYGMCPHSSSSRFSPAAHASPAEQPDWRTPGERHHGGHQHL